jgi:hypothetical protein
MEQVRRRVDGTRKKMFVCYETVLSQPVMYLPNDVISSPPGATTLCITTLSIMTLSIMTLSIITLSIMTLSIMKLSIMTLSIMTLSIT